MVKNKRDPTSIPQTNKETNTYFQKTFNNKIFNLRGDQAIS